MISGWFALAVKPRKENYVRRQLQSSGYTVVYPMYSKMTRHARRQTIIQAPLFPGYLFVKLTAPLQSWREVNSVPGSIGLLKSGSTPSPLKKDFVRDIVLNLSANGDLEFNRSLNRGERVQALGEPFDGMIGEVIKMTDGNRVKVLMDALNRKVELTLPRRAVIAAA